MATSVAADRVCGGILQPQSRLSAVLSAGEILGILGLQKPVFM